MKFINYIIFLILTVFSTYLFSLKVDIVPWGNSEIDGLYLIAFIYIFPIYIIFLCIDYYFKFKSYDLYYVFILLLFGFLIVASSSNSNICLVGFFIYLFCSIYLIFKLKIILKLK